MKKNAGMVYVYMYTKKFKCILQGSLTNNCFKCIASTYYELRTYYAVQILRKCNFLRFSLSEIYAFIILTASDCFIGYKFTKTPAG